MSNQHVKRRFAANGYTITVLVKYDSLYSMFIANKRKSKMFELLLADRISADSWWRLLNHNFATIRISNADEFIVRRGNDLILVNGGVFTRSCYKIRIQDISRILRRAVKFIYRHKRGL